MTDTLVLGHPDDMLGPRPALRLSASGQGQWQQCNRLWGFTYNHGFDATSLAMLMGTRIHKILEDYLSKGASPNLAEVFWQPHKTDLGPDGSPLLLAYYPGQIAAAGLGNLPPPGAAQTEVEFWFDTQSIRWHGTRDFQYREEGTGLAVVGDHKTTTDKQYTKTPAILAKDSQGVLYPAALAEQLGEKNIKNRWVYYLTKKGKYGSWVSEYLSTPEERQPILDQMDMDGVAMTRAYEAQTPALALTPNPDFCDAYGGCPHRKAKRCTLTLSQRLKTNAMSEDLNAFLARQMGAPAAGAIPATLPGYTAPQLPPPLPGGPGAAPALPPAQGAPPLPPVGHWVKGQPMNEVQEYLASKGKPDYMIASAADRPPPNEALNAMMALANPSLAPMPETEAGIINPPEAPKQPVSNLAAMPPAAFAAPPAFQVQALTLPTPLTSVSVAEPDPIQDAFTPLDRAALKSLAVQAGILDDSSKMREDSIRTLVRNAYAMGKLVPQAPSLPVAQPVQAPPLPVAQSVAQPLQAPPLPVQPSLPPREVEGVEFDLYIGCAPLGSVRYSPLEDFLVPVVNAICTSTQLPHWGMEDYGKGGPRLAAALAAYIQSEGVSTGRIVVDPTTEEARHCLPVLMRMASTVVRSFR